MFITHSNGSIRSKYLNSISSLSFIQFTDNSDVKGEYQFKGFASCCCSNDASVFREEYKDISISIS